MMTSNSTFIKTPAYMYCTQVHYIIMSHMIITEWCLHMIHYLYQSSWCCCMYTKASLVPNIDILLDIATSYLVVL